MSESWKDEKYIIMSKEKKSSLSKIRMIEDSLMENRAEYRVPKKKKSILVHCDQKSIDAIPKVVILHVNTFSHGTPYCT